MSGENLKDSGKRAEFDTGSVRDTEDNKGRFDLLPLGGLLAAARQFQRGAAKYGVDNWRKGQPVGRYISSAIRHLIEYREGYRDEPHLDAAVWNALALADTVRRIELGQLPEALMRGDDNPYSLPEPLPPDVAPLPEVTERAKSEHKMGFGLGAPPPEVTDKAKVSAAIGTLLEFWERCKKTIDTPDGTV